MSAQASAPQLRPLGIGEILDVGLKIYFRNWLTLFKIVVFIVLPAEILANVDRDLGAAERHHGR